MCTSFKAEILKGIHALGTTVTRGGTSADTLYAALYLASATKSAATTTYGGTVGSVADTGEVAGTNYTPGGVQVTNATAPTTSGTTGYWTPSANLVYGSAGSPVTLSTSFDAVLLFNNTQSNKAISVHTFGATTITAGIFTLTMPTNDASNALLRIA
jgi:hypothetical protein